MVLTYSKSRLGGLVGMTVMTGCVDELEWLSQGGKPFNGLSDWFVGPFGWLQAKGTMFPTVIPYKGQQGLFRVPVSIVENYEIGRAEYEKFLG